ncbi:DUF1835 domain-containing protein [Bacillus sp. CGMCC 1.16607]|uniref:DUF1835 domain-containing protein n=1 Tax=Bacillus sp. CGMCC 1.16607 TaxID=3351842 RepID=UPI00362646A2
MELEELKREIQDLSEEEVKSLLLHIFLRSNFLDNTEYSKEELVKDIHKMYRALFNRTKVETDKDWAPKRIHILFGPSPAGCLKVVLKDLDIEGEHVISLWDMFSVGPIWKLHEETGKKERFEWVKSSQNYSPEDFSEYEGSFRKTLNEIKMIPEYLPIIIWTADNAHEQTGLRYVLHLLKGRNNKIHIINTTKMHAKYFDRPEIHYVALHSGEISPERLKVIYEREQNGALTELERERYELDWLELADNRESLRIWENGKIKSVPEDFYDSYIVSKAKRLHRRRNVEEYMKSARLIGEVLGHLEQYVGDEFLEYRLRMLIDKGVFEFEGSLEAMRLYSVKLRKNQGNF